MSMRLEPEEIHGELERATPWPTEAALRTHLSPALQSRFERAWSLVPRHIHAFLSMFLRSVRSVKPGRKVRLRLSDGTGESIELQEGPAVFLLDQSAFPFRGWLLLREDLTDRPEPLLVLVILHELAHAVPGAGGSPPCGSGP
ncbi:MAG TPA: hypothetical protein VFQ76_15085 [Longimicrobiaceae bacterium]|nr:hypothetical protein [Longimicrobiaceae bacterium]